MAVPAASLTLKITALPLRSGSRLSGYFPNGNPAWRLPLDHSVAAKMPMVLVHPRPDSESNSFARHRKAHPGIQYRIPVSVQGGSYPFRYELLEGPGGMTIGEYPGLVEGVYSFDDDYGVVTWTPAEAGGPFTVRIRVTDQDMSSVDVVFTVTATTSGFVFVDPTAESAGDGTIGSPLKTFADIHKSNTDDDTYKEYAVYLRAGTHSVTGVATNFQITTSKPRVWIGYPGEEAVLNCSVQRFGVAAEQHDLWFSNITFDTNRTDETQGQFIGLGQSLVHRMTFDGLRFKNLTKGTSGDDNSSAIRIINPGVMRQYLTFRDCSLDDFEQPLTSVYAVQYAVMEAITIGTAINDGGNRQGVVIKSDLYDWSVRRVESLDQTFASGSVDLYGQSQTFPYDRVEVMYSTLKSTVAVKLMGVGSFVGENDNPDLWLTRCTLLGTIGGLTTQPYTAHIDGCVVINDNSPPIPVSSGEHTVISTNNLSGAAADNITDANGSLIGAYRSEYLGTRGAEVA